MKKILLIVALLLYKPLTAQRVVRYTTQELSTIGRVWGLLKYYDPTISQGRVDADSLLIKALTTYQQPTAIVANWMSLLREKKIRDTLSATCSDDTHEQNSFAWIAKDTYLKRQQKDWLYDLVSGKYAIGTFYSNSKNTGRYSGGNEKVYDSSDHNNIYQLVDLFRMWNVIEYFYPYKHLVSKPWENVLQHYLPEFNRVQPAAAYTKLLMRFAASIEDSHARIDPISYREVFGKYGPPFTFLVIGNKLVVTKLIDPKLCDSLAIQPGDVIESIDGKTIAAWIKANGRYIAASNDAVTKRDAYNYLGFSNLTSFSITGYSKNNRRFNKKVTAIDRTNDVWYKDGMPDNPLTGWDAANQKVICSMITKDNIGYIDFTLLDPADIDSLFTVMKNTKGIVFDLRGYNGDGGLLKTFNYLLPEPSAWGMLCKVNFNRPGSFCYQDYIIDEKYRLLGSRTHAHYAGKTVVLVNQHTQSVEEMWSMMFKAIPGVVFVGSQTAGADGNETPIVLTGDRKMIFSGFGIYYADKKQTQKIGIRSDITVYPTIKDIQNGIDPVQAKAFEILK